MLMFNLLLSQDSNVIWTRSGYQNFFGNRIMQYVGICVSTFVLASCVLTEPYAVPTAEKAPIANQFSDNKNTRPASRGEKIIWWTKFGDKKLNMLIAQALSQNLDVLQAIERVNAANASVQGTRGARFPSVDAQAVAVRQRESDRRTIDQKGVGAAALWTIDLTGRNRRNIRAALAQLEAAEANIVATKLLMVGDLVRTYIRMRGAQAEAHIAREAVTESRKISEFTERQFDNGVATALDVQLADARMSETHQDVPLALISFEVELAHLATLLSIPVDEIKKDMTRGARQPIGRGNVSLGVPADLLRNRYDIRAAERILAANYEQIGIAKADLYPSLTLTGNIVSASGVNVWQFGPQLTLPILNRSAIRTQVKLARSTADQSYLIWKQSVLQAVEQVESAQARRKHEQQSVAFARANTMHLVEAQKLAIKSYENGILPLQQLIEINRMVSDARVTVAQARTGFGQAFVDLQLALGGYVE
jgi:multidrug efflux system outer membrane protein